MTVEINGSSPTPLHNDSIDVTAKDCFGSFDEIACMRRSVLAFLMTFTFFLCVIKLVRFIVKGHARWNEYFIFSAAILQCAASVSSCFLDSRYPQLDIVATGLKLAQLAILNHLYWTTIPRHLSTGVASKVVAPIVAVYSAFILAVTVVGSVDVGSSWTECFKPYWLLLSGADVIGAQLLLYAGIRMTHLKRTAVVGSVSLEEHSWFLVMAYFISSLVSLAYDITLRLVGDEAMGCSGVFSHAQVLYTSVFSVFYILKYLVPVLAQVIILVPLTRDSIGYSELSGNSCRPSRSSYDDNNDVIVRTTSDYAFDNETSVTRQLFGSRTFIRPTLPLPGVITQVPGYTQPRPVGIWGDPREYMRSRQRAMGGSTSTSPALNVIYEETSSVASTFK